MVLRLFGGALIVATFFFGTLWILDDSASRPVRPNPAIWREELYLAVNPDVAAAIARGEVKSGYEHYQLAGRSERRQGGSIPAYWDEAGYLKANPDVATAVKAGSFLSGYHHYLAAGQKEGRLGGIFQNR
jgi:hypothetical protein